METIFCPKCRAINNSANTYCGSCHQPLRGLPKKPPFRFSLFLLIIFLLVLFASGGALIFIEIKYPDYALRKRLTYSWEIMFQRDWLKKYGEYKSLEKEVQDKKLEKARLIRDIKKLNARLKNLKSPKERPPKPKKKSKKAPKKNPVKKSDNTLKNPPPLGKN
ncbi:MAG: hypothetical protein OEZ36_06600 [Spirochaetota bacterium]|nr:hypothetical protein [Spirochaetota bacterium]